MIIILLKEFYLLFFQTILLKNEIVNYKKFLIQILIFNIILLLDSFSLYLYTKYTLVLIFIILAMYNFNYNLIKKYFFNQINENN